MPELNMDELIPNTTKLDFSVMDENSFALSGFGAAFNGI